MIPKQCCGINSYGSGGSKKGDRCKVKVNDAHRLQRCLNANKDMCFMHCDCSYCSENYQKTANRGKRHSSAESQIEFDAAKFKRILLLSEDILDLKALCLEMLRLYPMYFQVINMSAKKRIKKLKLEIQLAEYEEAVVSLKKQLGESNEIYD